MAELAGRTETAAAATELKSRSPRHWAEWLLRQPTLLLWMELFAVVVLAHATLLRLPYFWDEGGYYVPAALDFYHHGALIPEFTNAHPPLPNILIGSAWRIFGFRIVVTRLLACAAAAGGLLAVLRLAQLFLPAQGAWSVCLLTGVYSIWFAQSSLAHADIFAAGFTLWGLFAFFRTEPSAADDWRTLLALAGWFSLAALSKETAIVQNGALAGLEAVRAMRTLSGSPERKRRVARAAALAFPVLPLAAWFAYHRLRTGFTFGNPEFLRYNATANLTLAHLSTALRYRLLHLFWQRMIWIPLLAAALCLLWRSGRDLPARFGLPGSVLRVIAVLVVANWLAFSVLGGALLTRYLLPVYPLLLLLCVAVWIASTRYWPALVTGTAVLFIASWWVNPATFFAPEDNLTYRDMVVVHQEAIRFVSSHFPDATVLTAWPVAADLVRPELGYLRQPLQVTSIDDFSFGQIRKAAGEPEAFDTALVFSTKFVPPALAIYFDRHPNTPRARDYATTRDLCPAEIAALLHGQVVWQDDRDGEWAAVLRFPRSYQAGLGQPVLFAARSTLLSTPTRQDGSEP